MSVSLRHAHRGSHEWQMEAEESLTLEDEFIVNAGRSLS